MARGSRRVVADLEVAVQEKLRSCEHKIDQALEGAWHALREIQEGKLYKADGYSSFEEYAEKRWGYSKSHAYRLIDHSKIVDHLKSEGVEFLPGGEGLTRPLAKLRRTSKSEGEFLQKASEAWRIATDTAPKAFDVPQVTTTHVESSMQHFGLYRNAKKSSESADLTELRSVLTKLSQCEALKDTAESFASVHGAKACPSKFYETVMWLQAYAEACGGEG